MIRWFKKLFIILSSPKVRLKVKLKLCFSIVKCVYELPGIIFHEFCHVMMAMLTITNIRLKYFYFCRLKINKRRWLFRSYHCRLNMSGSPIQCILVGAAPAIGTTILSIILLLSHCYWPFLYFITAYHTFLLSEQDRHCVRSSIAAFKFRRSVVVRRQRIPVIDLLRRFYRIKISRFSYFTLTYLLFNNLLSNHPVEKLQDAEILKKD